MEKDGTLFLLYRKTDLEKMTGKKFSYCRGLNGHYEIALSVDNYAEVDAAYKKVVAAESLGIPYEGFHGETLFGMAEAGNETALTCARNYARQIAVQVMNLQFVLDPDRIGIGGGVSAEKILITLIKEELQKLMKVF